MGEKAKLLADQNVEVERKNREVEQARQALEEKAKQLALTSKYKSEFLANMSHELRTPLNSLLILSDELSRNKDQNLSAKQVEFARTIHASGNDLLALINDILDLSKIESGTVMVDVGEVALRDLQDYVERTFRHVAETKKLEFEIDRTPDLPRTIQTDAKRLQQILKNLLSNAFKFTEKGRVSLLVSTGHGRLEPRERNPQPRQIGAGLFGDATPASAFRRTNSKSSLRRSNRPTAAPAANTAAPAWVWPSAAKSRACWAAKSGSISAPDEGSTFTLYPAAKLRAGQTGQAPGARCPPAQDVIVRSRATWASPPPARKPPLRRPMQFDDDSDNIQPDDRVLLIVENDASFAQFLLEMAHESGFKGIISSRGADALAVVRAAQARRHHTRHQSP